MSKIKQYYEEHFDEYTYDELRSWGLSPYEIYLQWDSFSHLSWKDWKEGKRHG